MSYLLYITTSNYVCVDFHENLVKNPYEAKAIIHDFGHALFSKK